MSCLQVAEIACLTLQETGLVFSGIVDEEMAGEKFFGWEIGKMSDIATLNYDRVIVASYLNREKLYKALLYNKVANDLIRFLFSI